MLLPASFVFFIFFIFFYFNLVFCSFFITCLNKDCPNNWVVDVNSFMSFRLRMMSFSIEIYASKFEDYQLPIH
jgi:hypothetical protein